MKINRLLQQFLLVSVLAFGMQATAQAQSPTPYGNEWIDYNKTYYKLKIVNTGLHRLSHGFLDSLGLAGTNPQHFQLFRRGKEVAIHVAGEADGRLDTQDFIEFYGERNDGRLDQDLYKNPAHQLHQLYSLYTDTAAYFLTVNPAGGKRMQQVNPSPAGKTPEPYHLQKVTQYFAGRYHVGRKYGTTSSLHAWMDEGEGYFSFIGTSDYEPKSYDITAVSNLVSTGPRPTLEYALATVGTNKSQEHHFNVNITLPNGSKKLLSRFQIKGDGYAKGKSTLEFSDVHSAGKIVLETEQQSDKSRLPLSFTKVTFPQRTAVSGNTIVFFTDSTRAVNPYFEVVGAGASSTAYDITDPYNPVRIQGHISGQNKGFVIPTQARTHKVLLVNLPKYFKPASKPEVNNFRRIDAAAHNYIILTNKRLMKPVAGAQRSAPTEFAAYRASATGGGYDTLLVHMGQVVDQFHYGEFSSNAIRKFMSFMLTSDRPKHLFIIGKGAKYAWDDYTAFPEDKPAGKYSFYHIDARYPKVHELDLVPTGMIPSSDVFFTADFRNDRFEPRVPTGRLAATEPSHIIAYLNKVKEYETLPEGLEWRKNILQLGGGNDPTQIEKFTGFLNVYKSIAEGVLFGGNVLEKYRQNVSDKVEVINVSDEVNAGLSLITFFGHSSTSTTDLDIGFVSANVYGYRNKGRYPVIIMNGCYSGDAFIYNRKTFGEDWLLTPDRGAVSFMSQSYIGGDEPLHEYTHNYYKTAYQNDAFYGKTVGEIQKEVARLHPISNFFSDKREEHIVTVMQMVLQGDPAIRPYAPSKPDYTFTNNTFRITDLAGEVPNASSEKIILHLNVNNLGKAIGDSVHIAVKRTLADNTELEPVYIKTKPILKRTQVEMTLPNVDSLAAGLNKFEIILDYNNSVDELDESNNVLRIQHFIPKSGISVLAPAEFSIVNNTKVNLVVQSTQLNAEPKGVYFELDTTQLFNSPIIKSFSAPSGVLPAWGVSLPLQGTDLDSTVFYWRARFAEFAQDEDTVWVQSSFRYIENSTSGWSQSHSGQFMQVGTNRATFSPENNKWEFGELYRNIEIRTVGGDIPYDQPPYGVFINGVNQIDNACGNFRSATKTPRMYFFVLNHQELNNIRVDGFNPCKFMDNLYQFAVNTASSRLTVQRFLDAIPQESYVIAVTVHKVPFNDFSPELKNSFRNLGSKLIDELKTGYPLAFVGQKGTAPGSAQELSADNSVETPATEQDVILRASVTSRTTQGTVTSTTIGPALSWGSLHYNIERYKTGDDSYKLSLFGIDAEGNRSLLNDEVTSKTLDLSQVSATQYPHLQLQAQLSDTEDRTAPQLKQWMVYYQAAPEGVIRPDLVEMSEEIVTQQASRGLIDMPMAFQNITPYAFRDSITVEVTVTGEGIEPMVSRFKIEALEGNQTANFNFSMPTVSLDGNYKLIMYVNPRLQPEQQYQNNIYEVKFSVKSKLHPIMDVAFDGVHIMDGELVSPSPLISITMKDENKHVFLENADAMEVYLEGSNIQGQYDVKNEAKPSELRVSPADEKNDFRLEYKPEKLETGDYILTVRGKDVTGKSSGKDYKINFKVDTESKVTNFYPYPNPFSTKTQFIFTLTGGVIPDNFKIQIMTVTGKIVKEIMREEIGPIRIGNNKTEYAWDGTDMYGDKLANGVYLYRVVMPKDTEEMKHIWKKGDKGFVNGYGKIYILR